MDSSKPGKGILASLEHKASEPARRPAASSSAASSAARGPALVVGGGTVLAGLLAWWLHSGPSPVMMHETLPPPIHLAHAVPPLPRAELAAEHAAAAIVDDTAQPAPAASPALAALLAPAPIAAAAVMKKERVVAVRTQPKPKPKKLAARQQVHRAPLSLPDTDVALLSALVAHANDRDVVEPRAGDSTASLLQRCGRVGGEEGRLCRIRICASRAGDRVCRSD